VGDPGHPELPDGTEEAPATTRPPENPIPSIPAAAQHSHSLEEQFPALAGGKPSFPAASQPRQDPDQLPGAGAWNSPRNRRSPAFLDSSVTRPQPISFCVSSHVPLLLSRRKSCGQYDSLAQNIAKPSCKLDCEVRFENHAMAGYKYR